MRNFAYTILMAAMLLCAPHSICAQSNAQKARMQQIRARYAKAVEKANQQQKAKQNYITLDTKETTPNGEVQTKHVEYIFDVKGNECQLLMIRKNDNNGEFYREYLFEDGKIVFTYNRTNFDVEIGEDRYYLTDGTPFWRMTKMSNAKTKKTISEHSAASNGMTDDMWMFTQAEGEQLEGGFHSLVNEDRQLFELDTRQKQMTDAQQQARIAELRKQYAEAQQLSKKGFTGTKQTYGFADIHIKYPNVQRHRTAEYIIGMEMDETFDVYMPMLKFIRAKEENGYNEFLFDQGRLVFAFATAKNVSGYKKGEFRFYLNDDDTNVPFWHIIRYYGDEAAKPASEQEKPFNMNTPLPAAIDWYNTARYGYNLYHAFYSIYSRID